MFLEWKVAMKGKQHCVLSWTCVVAIESILFRKSVAHRTNSVFPR